MAGIGCTSAQTLTCLTNAADELARGGCGRGRDGGDDARATTRQTPLRLQVRRRRDPGQARDARRLLATDRLRAPRAERRDLGRGIPRLKPSLPGPAVLRGLLAGLIEHVAAWPLTVVFDRYHPARKELPKLATNPRAFGQATIRHAVFGIVLGLLEDALNDRTA